MTQDERQTRLEDAVRLLRAMLADGPRRSREVKDAATQLGIPLYVLGQARRALGVKVGAMRGALTTWELREQRPGWRDPEETESAWATAERAFDLFLGAAATDLSLDPGPREDESPIERALVIAVGWRRGGRAGARLNELRLAMDVAWTLEEAEDMVRDPQNESP